MKRGLQCCKHSSSHFKFLQLYLEKTMKIKQMSCVRYGVKQGTITSWNIYIMGFAKGMWFMPGKMCLNQPNMTQPIYYIPLDFHTNTKT